MKKGVYGVDPPPAAVAVVIERCSSKRFYLLFTPRACLLPHTHYTIKNRPQSCGTMENAACFVVLCSRRVHNRSDPAARQRAASGVLVCLACAESREPRAPAAPCPSIRKDGPSLRTPTAMGRVCRVLTLCVGNLRHDICIEMCIL